MTKFYVTKSESNFEKACDQALREGGISFGDEYASFCVDFISYKCRVWRGGTEHTYIFDISRE